LKWSESTLGALVERDHGLIQTGPFGSQLHEHEYQPEGIPVVMPKDIRDGRVVADSVARVSEQTASRLARHQLRNRAIVLPRRGEIAKRAFIRDDEEGWLCGTGCIKIELGGEHLIPEFLYYYMEQGHVVTWLEQHAVGTTMLNLSTRIVADLPIQYPTPNIQRRIGDSLSAYDTLIENNRRRLSLLEESARILYHEWFVRFRFPGYRYARVTHGMPEGWQRKALGDLCADVRESVTPDNVDPNTPYIGLEHIPRRSISLTQWGRAESVDSQKYRYRSGDILFGKIRPYFHKVGIAFTGGITSSDAIVVRPISDEVRAFVLMLMSSDEFVAEVSQAMREGSKMPRADWKLMTKYTIAIPPSGLLALFSKSITAITDQLRALSAQNDRLRAARVLLLPRLMSGELAV
jgi:type I restriction enzyme S subunit